jgi:hypothetical protein
MVTIYMINIYLAVTRSFETTSTAYQTTTESIEKGGPFVPPTFVLAAYLSSLTIPSILVLVSTSTRAKHFITSSIIKHLMTMFTFFHWASY